MEKLKEFCTTLLATQISIHTDHKNLSHELTWFQMQCVMQWNLSFFKEFSPKFYNIEGKNNNVADCLSHLRLQEGEKTALSEDSIIMEQQKAEALFT